MIRLRFIDGVTSHFSSRRQEWGMAVMLGMISLDIRPGTFAMSPNYAVMSNISEWFMRSAHPELLWQWVGLTLVTLRLIALILNGSFPWFARYSPWIRAITAILGGGMWFMLAFAFFRANPRALGVPLFFGLMLTECVMFYVIMGEVGASEGKLRNGCKSTRPE